MSFRETQQRNNFYNSINYILNLNEPWNLVKNITNVLKNLEIIAEINFNQELAFEWLNEDKKLKLIEIIIDYLKYSYENIKENIQNYNLIVKYENQSLVDCSGVISQSSSQQCKIYSLLQFSLLMWNWADKSVYFCVKFHDLNGVKILFKYVNDNLLIFHLVEKLKYQNMRKYEKAYLNLALTYKSIVGSIHNLSKFEYKYRIVWNDLNAFQNLFNLAKLFSDEKNKFSNLDIDLLAYFGLIYLVRTGVEFTNLNDIDKYIYKVVDLLQQCGTDMSTKSSIDRKLFKISDRIEIKEIAIVTSKENTQWRLTELVEFLSRVCDFSEKFKNDTFESFSSLRLSIKQILFYGNEIEKEHILKLIWKLCFNSDLTCIFRSDIDLCSFIIGLSYNKLIKSKNILKYSELILYLFDGLEKIPINVIRVESSNATIIEANNKKMHF